MTKSERKEFEDAGIHVLEVTNDGKITYQTENNNSNLCNSCPHLRLLPDPDPDDSFRDTDSKAYCSKYDRIIARYLDVWEASKVNIPDFCLSRNSY